MNKSLKKILIICTVFILNTNQIFPQQFNQLADAVIKKDTIKIQQLLQSGVDINIQDPASATTVINDSKQLLLL